MATSYFVTVIFHFLECATSTFCKATEYSVTKQTICMTLDLLPKGRAASWVDYFQRTSSK